jgi:AraC family transcriptional regulator
MKTETRSFYESAVARTVAHIAQTLDEALDLGALAKGAALSPFHFHRVFRGMVFETPLEMHRRLRLERAAWQLIERNDAVTTIAFGAGYETHEAFTRAFRQAYGTSPSAFRQGAVEPPPGCARPQIELAAPCGVHFSATASVRTIQFAQGESTMKVLIEDMPELRVAAVRHVGPYNRISEAFARLGAVAAPAGLLRPGAMMLAIYYDDPEAKPPELLESDAAITVPDGVHRRGFTCGLGRLRAATRQALRCPDLASGGDVPSRRNRTKVARFDARKPERPIGAAGIVRNRRSRVRENGVQRRGDRVTLRLARRLAGAAKRRAHRLACLPARRALRILSA